MRALIGLGGWRELKLETEYRFLFNGEKKSMKDIKLCQLGKRQKRK